MKKEKRLPPTDRLSMDKVFRKIDIACGIAIACFGAATVLVIVAIILRLIGK